MLYAVETADSSYLQLGQVGERCGARRVCVCVGGGGGGGALLSLWGGGAGASNPGGHP